MTAKLDLAQEKLIRKVRAARQKWVNMVKSARSLDEYVRKISQVTGLPEGTVRASLPAKNYAEFQRNADKYVDLLISNVEAAIRAGKWKEKYIEAFKS